MRVGLYCVWAVLAGASFVNATAIVPPEAGEAAATLVNGEMLKWAVTQGGLVLVTLTVLWSYRRDFKSAIADRDSRDREREAQMKVVADLVEKNTVAMTSLTEVVRTIAGR